MRRKRVDQQVIATRARERDQHRQEATAHQQRAAEVGSEAARKRQQADQLETEAERLQQQSDQRREEAADLEERGERSLAYAQRHEGAAAEKNEEAEHASKPFRVR